MNDRIVTSKKELAAELGRNPRFVLDMIRGGFKFPAPLSEAVNFLRRNPHPTIFRQKSQKVG